MNPFRYFAAIALTAFALPGCLTVGMNNEFQETVEAYRPDGTVETVTQTLWTQNARGGPFTDVERLKQDTVYKYADPEGGSYEIGQGSGAEGVRGAGQTEALSMALQALSNALNWLNPASNVPATPR